MIYLIDDKRIRQKDNGWTIDKFENYEGILYPIYSVNELTQEVKNNIFSHAKIILFHESFFDNPENKHSKDVHRIRQDLISNANQNKSILVFFSGSIGNRTINENIAYIPTNILYSNLNVFLDSFSKGDININYLVFGDNYKREKDLLIKQKLWNLMYELREVPKNNLEFSDLLLKLNLKIDTTKIDDLQLLKSIIKEI
jgi:hypothetical protein